MALRKVSSSVSESCFGFGPDLDGFRVLLCSIAGGTGFSGMSVSSGIRVRMSGCSMRAICSSSWCKRFSDRRVEDRTDDGAGDTTRFGFKLYRRALVGGSSSFASNSKLVRSD